MPNTPLAGTIWIIDSPPKCLLVKVAKHKFVPVGSLAPGLMPLFSTSFSIDVHVPEALASATGKGISTRRRQIPCCAAFAITDYRSQDRTFSNVIPDLEPPNPRGTRGGHHTYTAVYVALSRCRSSLGLSFLRAFPHAIFLAKPDNALPAEQTRLEASEMETSAVNYEALLAAY